MCQARALGVKETAVNKTHSLLLKSFYSSRQDYKKTNKINTYYVINVIKNKATKERWHYFRSGQGISGTNCNFLLYSIISFIFTINFLKCMIQRYKIKTSVIISYSQVALNGDLSANAEVPGSIPGSGRSPGGGNGNPLYYSCLENSMDRGAWWATVHGVANSRLKRLSIHYKL